MRSLGGDERLDEVHCLRALCPHPCCWEAERRIAEGVYRRAVRAPTKRHAYIEESLPSLTLVDVCEWARARAESSDPSRIPSQAVPPRNDITPRFKTTPLTCSTDPSFPAINSAANKSRTGENGTGGKGVRDNTAHVGPLIDSPWASGSLVLWVTNPHYIPRCLQSSEPLRCAVKELICIPADETQNTPKANRKGTTKRVRFQLTCSHLAFHPGQRAESVCPGQQEAGTGDVLDEPRHPRGPSAFLVKNKPVVFHSVRERRVRRASQDAPATRYKLDNKTGKEDVDWDSLRGQPYLWKRRNVPPELLDPPGGARGAQEAFVSCAVSKVSSDQTLHSPMCAAPAVKRTLRYGRYTHPLLSHKKHSRGTESELDMTIRSISAVTKHNQLHRMLDPDERRERERDRKVTVTPFNSEVYGQCSTHELYGLRISSGEMEPWGGRSSTEHLCTSIPSLSYL